MKAMWHYITTSTSFIIQHAHKYSPSYILKWYFHLVRTLYRYYLWHLIVLIANLHDILSDFFTVWFLASTHYCSVHLSVYQWSAHRSKSGLLSISKIGFSLHTSSWAKQDNLDSRQIVRDASLKIPAHPLGLKNLPGPCEICHCNFNSVGSTETTN